MRTVFYIAATIYICGSVHRNSGLNKSLFGHFWRSLLPR